MKWFVIILLSSVAVAVELSEKEKNQGCHVACLRSGYDGGTSHGRGCRCHVDFENYNTFIRTGSSLQGLNLGTSDDD
jgi:hypothetical protein